MKILVTGATGMLGREVYRAGLDAGHQVTGLSHAELDITCRQAVEASVRGYDAVINCAGLTKHAASDATEAADYHRANTYGPLLLASECSDAGVRLVHVSTDCVFSGRRPVEDGPYYEDDVPDAEDYYGISKQYGEVRGAPHLTVRCSFVGNGDRGLLAALRRGEVQQVWRRAFWSGSTAPAIARALVTLAPQREVTGVMHLTDGMCYSKADLIEAAWYAMGNRVPYHAEVAYDPQVNRWLDTHRDDVPALPSLHAALEELADAG